MEFLIKFLQKLFMFTNMVMPFVFGIPGYIVTCCLAIGGPLLAMATNFGNACTITIRFFDLAIESVEGLNSLMASSQYFGFFSNLLALDELGKVITSFLTIATILVVLSVFEIVFQGIVVAVPFLTYKAISKIVQASTLGYVKV